MSNAVSMNPAVSTHDGYTVQALCGCRIVYGEIPLRDLGALTRNFSTKALMDVSLADRLGASLVIGEPEALEELRKRDLPVSAKRQRDFQAALALGLADAALWLRDGERGLSSNAMCKRIFGVPADAGINHPHDPDDLRRCLQFLDATRAHGKVALMADVSGEWARLMTKWDCIVATFKRETQVPGATTAPRTYAMMKEAIDGSKAA